MSIILLTYTAAGDFVLISLTPAIMELARLTALSSQNGHRTVQDARELDLNGKVHVAQVSMMLIR